jgi:hypothetical protein
VARSRAVARFVHGLPLCCGSSLPVQNARSGERLPLVLASQVSEARREQVVRGRRKYVAAMDGGVPQLQERNCGLCRLARARHAVCAASHARASRDTNHGRDAPANTRGIGIAKTLRNDSLTRRDN